jgi:hypothetical protein
MRENNICFDLYPNKGSWTRSGILPQLQPVFLPEFQPLPDYHQHENVAFLDALGGQRVQAGWARRFPGFVFDNPDAHQMIEVTRRPSLPPEPCRQISTVFRDQAGFRFLERKAHSASSSSALLKPMAGRFA